MAKHRRKGRDIPVKFVLIPLGILFVGAFIQIFGPLVLVGVIIIVALYYVIKAGLNSLPKLIEYGDGFGKKVYGTFDQIAKLQELDDSGENPGTLLNDVKLAIEEFRPSQRYDSELGYHAELVGYLKTRFPNLKMEEQIGSSRPDITIQDIAIEVKGPTGNKALDSLTTKCLKYLQHYPHLIVVLFEPFFNEGHYSEIERGLEIKFPNLIIVRKPNYFVYNPDFRTRTP